MAADIAADVGRVAAVVEASAEKVDDALRPEGARIPRSRCYQEHLLVSVHRILPAQHRHAGDPTST